MCKEDMGGCSFYFLYVGAFFPGRLLNYLTHLVILFEFL